MPQSKMGGSGAVRSASTSSAAVSGVPATFAVADGAVSGRSRRWPRRVVVSRSYSSIEGAFSVGAENDAYLHRAGESELRWMGETSTYFLATGEQTRGAFALVDEQPKRGESVPLHVHRDDMESFYVIDGEIMLYIGDQPGIRAGAGSFAHVPGGTVHGFRIESDTARYLILTTPRHGQFYRAINLPSRAGGLPPLESINGSQIKQASKEYGVEFVGPLPDER